MFLGFLNSKINIIKNDGRTFNDIPADVQESIIFLEDVTIPIEKGDTIERKIPSGVCEKYTVVNPVYYEGFDNIPGHYEIKISRT